MKMKMVVVYTYDTGDHETTQLAYQTTNPEEIVAIDTENVAIVGGPEAFAALCDLEPDSVKIEVALESHDKVAALLGKRVRATLNNGGYPDPDAKAVVAEGQLLGFGADGSFEIQEDDGFVHYCWPLLGVEEVPVEQGT